MSKFRVFITSRAFGRITEEAVTLLQEVAQVERAKSERPLEKEDLIEKTRDCHGLILGIEKITSEIMDHARNLVIIARYGVGYDNVDVEAATKKRIVVTHTPHANSTSVAEHTFALILSLSKRVVEANLSLKSGEWLGTKFVGFELGGKTIGIVGAGAIGRKVASIARGFDMNALLYDIVTDESVEESLGAKYVSLRELLMSSDIVSIHVPLTSETYHMIGENELTLMRRNAMIVNTSRGGIVDESALTRHLEDRSIAGAALDVFEEEPPRGDSPLLRMENVVCTPHSSSFTVDSLRRMDTMVAKDVVSALLGEKPRHMVNRELQDLFSS